MTIKENNILLGDVMEDGTGGLKETGDTWITVLLLIHLPTVQVLQYMLMQITLT